MSLVGAGIPSWFVVGLTGLDSDGGNCTSGRCQLLGKLLNMLDVCRNMCNYVGQIYLSADVNTHASQVSN